jgi:hypothetical protein
MLPPIIYTPVPKPKKTENRPKTRRIQTKDATEDARDIEETGEVSASRGLRTTPPPSQNAFTAVDGAERRIPSTTGKLSEDTLKELLLAQEQDQGSVSGSPAAKE